MIAPVPTRRLHDGSVVPYDSAAWIAECEARTILRMDTGKQRDFLALLEQKRGDGAVRKVRDLMFVIEPAYLLDLPGQEARRAYLHRVEMDSGHNARTHLEARSLALWESRKPAKGTAA